MLSSNSRATSAPELSCARQGPCSSLKRLRPCMACRSSRDSPHPVRTGLSQTLTGVTRGADPAPILRFVNLRETEAEREQPVLLSNGPRAHKPEPLAQPQHGLEALDRTPGCVEGLKAPDPGHVLLDPD